MHKDQKPRAQVFLPQVEILGREVPQHRSAAHPLLANLPHTSPYVFIAQFCGAGHHLGTTAPEICIYIHWINLGWRHKSEHHGHHFLIFRQGHPQQGKRKPLENPVLSRGLWRSGWDSNPRALADNLISSALCQNNFTRPPWTSLENSILRKC